MHVIALVLGCLACASHARKVQLVQGNAHQEQPTEALAALLVRSNPQAAWQVTGAGRRSAIPGHEEFLRHTAKTPAAAGIRCADAEEDSGKKGSGFSVTKAPASAKDKLKSLKKKSLKKKGKTVSKNIRKEKSRLDEMAAAEDRGRRLLEQMRVSAGINEIDWTALQKEKDLKAELAQDPTAGVMPEKISQRMLGRLKGFAGVPVGTTVVTWLGFFYLQSKEIIDLPASYIAYFTIFLLLVSFAGISWGVLSTELDESKEQSFWGQENVKPNFEILRGVDREQKERAFNEFERKEMEKAGLQFDNEQAMRLNWIREREAKKKDDQMKEFQDS